MRTFLSSLLAVGLVAGPASAELCARPVERAAFDVAALKSQLMVTAISCKAEERYNSFVMRFRPDLVKHEGSLNGYFQRSFGRRATQEHDDYITSLANAQSMTGIKLGTAFCQQNIGLFDEVMGLHSGAELAALAGGHATAQPIALSDCPAQAATTRTAFVATGTNTRKH